ncbi:increased DNA methylation 1-like [Gastrolobium bilobum]|uniref:increased DNA methylation 1-like n=1 Tax=Gastrolobium bilobum TaxID=150636 RepID=UPI002AAF99B0|nr:increased DNA methylation 1-like [Gastrolobium bilobum]XP_061337028.1 increased DNA methylation 1-like [Gastrolobium bilobum]XP_061337029.1 increased DNA methylation 1-like [Gastrolobium bilobum]XP_061337031.1 increased DNA methylation 1-like [Gastrolobium bilobum]
MVRTELSMTRTNNMTDTLRHRNQRVNYIEISDPGSDSFSSDPENSRCSPTRLTTRRKTTLCSPRVLETEMMDSSVGFVARGGHGDGQEVEPIRWGVKGTQSCISKKGEAKGELNRESAEAIKWGILGTRSCFSKKRVAKGEQNKESVEPIKWGIQGTRSCVSKKRATNGEQKKESVESIKWGIQGIRSCISKKRAVKGEKNKENNIPVPSSIMEKGPSSPERLVASMKKDSLAPVPVRLSKKTILSWLIDYKLIDEDEQVCYMDGTKEYAALRGRITRGGILCSCCQRETSVWTFEKHAGSDLKQPYEHIYLLQKGTCLQDCLIAAWQDARERKRRCRFSYVLKGSVADQNDDACSICGDGGELICCDQCPSTYHPSCMNMERVPHNNWLCPYCICKYCGIGGDSKEFITCSQCDKKFHWGCFKEFEKEFSKETLDLNCSRLYCGPGCREIYEKLESSLGTRNDVFARYSWRVIRQMDMTPKVVSAARNSHIENNSKVAATWMLMNEAFNTIIDRHTGINLVESIVYSRGSNLSRINFSRFYTFILEKDDEIIAAACVRFHGRRIAEMPFIATEEAYRRQGISRALLTVIESFLCSLKVENLIFPSFRKTTEMWKRKYGFKEMCQELKRDVLSYNILMLPDALRLYKNFTTSIADGDNNRDNQNDLEPQTEQGGRPLFDLNVALHEEDY